MSDRSDHDFSDLINYEYLDSDPNVHTYLFGLSHLDGQPLVVLAEPLDAHQYFVPQASQSLENGISCWERPHQARVECSTSQLAASLSTDFEMDVWDQVRTAALSREQKEVSKEQQVDCHSSFDPKYQTGDDVMLSASSGSAMPTSHPAHIQPSRIKLPNASPSPSASPISNVPGHQTHDYKSSVESSSLPVRHTPGYIDPSSLDEPAPVLREKGCELPRSMCNYNLLPTTETGTAFAGKHLAPAGLGQASEAVSSILQARGSTPEPRSTLGTLAPSHPKPTFKSTSRGASFATRPADRNKVEKKPPRQSKSRYRTSLSPISSGPKPKVQPSIKPYVSSDSHGVADATNTLLLASKSNYRNILDGTIVPGGLYPASFSTALASKRTSHKTAEQERRERFNKALDHLQAMLPSSLDEAIEIETSDSCAAQASNCKAGRIEIAVKYINRLQRQVSEKGLLIQARVQEIDRLKRDLAAEKRSSRMDSAEGAAVT